MKEKVRNAYELAAQKAGLRLDTEIGVLYGQRDGYQILVYPAPGKDPYQLRVSVSAVPGSSPLNQSQKIEFIRDNPVVSLNQEGNAVVMGLISEKNPDQLGSNLNRALTAMLSFLRTGGWQPCCDACGRTDTTSPYVLADSFLQLCPTCAAVANQNSSAENQRQLDKKENFPAGLLGAFLGSLLGVLAIILFSRLNLIAAISGSIMAACALKGYELLGGKMTKRGAVACLVIMIVMTFLGDLVDWAILLAMETDVNFLIILGLMPELLLGGYMEDSGYVTNLAMLYLFMALGAVPTIRSTLKEKQTNNRFARIGGSYISSL